MTPLGLCECTRRGYWRKEVWIDGGLVRSFFGQEDGIGCERVGITEFDGPEAHRVIEEPVLPEPKPGEVRVKASATAAAFTDVMIRTGMCPDVKRKPTLSPGCDMVGAVDNVGEGVSRFKAGRNAADLLITGACSGYICLPENHLALVPDGLDPAEALSLVLVFCDGMSDAPPERQREQRPAKSATWSR